MKKHIVTITLVCCALLAASPLPAQNGSGAEAIGFNVNKYASYFLKGGKLDGLNDYALSATDADYEKFGAIAGDLEEPDTPLEFALLSYYS
jgi:hypothetical protein